jgi:8-oxo-dGTP diphosphatase
MNIGHFLGGVGACIYDPQIKKYLILLRSEHRDFGANQWECLTGRVNQGESFSQALHREVYEEIKCKIKIDFIIGTTHFFRGSENPKNELLGVIYSCSILDKQIPKLGKEHSALRWVSANEAYDILPKGNWLYNAIQKAEMIRSQITTELLEYFQVEGFEI